ncbi:hypothetical protein LCGC14_1611040, partial [marine sediment metagenome]
MRKSKKNERQELLSQEMKDYKLDPDAMIQVFDLTKVYNITEGIEVRALNGVSLD